MNTHLSEIEMVEYILSKTQNDFIQSLKEWLSCHEKLTEKQRLALEKTYTELFMRTV